VAGLEYTTGSAHVYTLTVATDHTFFVAAAQVQVLVHNIGPCPPYSNRYPGDWNPAPRLTLTSRDGAWYVTDPLGRSTRASGLYQFIVTTDHKVFLTPDSSPSGHADLARGEDLNYAGELRFTSSRNNRGQLTEWSNRSGHYKPDPSYNYLATDAIPELLSVPFHAVKNP